MYSNEAAGMIGLAVCASTGKASGAGAACIKLNPCGGAHLNGAQHGPLAPLAALLPRHQAPAGSRGVEGQ